MPDRRADRRANAGRPDKPARSYGAPMSTPAPTTVKRRKVGPADAATRRREIERTVQEGREASQKARADTATRTKAPKPPPETVGTPGRSTYETLRDRSKDTDAAVERAAKGKK